MTITLLFSTTLVSTFCCSVVFSVPLSWAFLRMRCTASITSLCCARKALPRSVVHWMSSRESLDHVGQARPEPGRSGPRVASRLHRRAPCPSGSCSSPATAGAGRFREDTWTRPGSGPATGPDRAQSAPRENPTVGRNLRSLRLWQRPPSKRRWHHICQGVSWHQGDGAEHRHQRPEGCTISFRIHGLLSAPHATDTDPRLNRKRTDGTGAPTHSAMCRGRIAKIIQNPHFIACCSHRLRYHGENSPVQQTSGILPALCCGPNSLLMNLA